MGAVDGAALPRHPGPAGESRSPEYQAALKLLQDKYNKKPESEYEILEEDVLIVGSGPIGAVFARKLVDGGKSVLMIEMGEQGTLRIGDHKKNSVAVQKDISRFTNIVKGELQLLSVPTNHVLPNLEPNSWGAGTNPKSQTDPCDSNYKPVKTGFLQNGQNPDQQAWENLAVAAASRVVGGMGSHWTCCTPRQHPGLERSDLFDDKEWDNLYLDAENLFRTNRDSFEASARQQLVKRVLRKAYPKDPKDPKDPGREILSMPLACKRGENREYVEWTSSATILGKLSHPRYSKGLDSNDLDSNDLDSNDLYRDDRPKFKFRPSTQLLELARDEVAPGRVRLAIARDLQKNKDLYIVARQWGKATHVG
jgi:pyranose oxidase